jgi:hypothetical protein
MNGLTQSIYDQADEITKLNLAQVVAVIKCKFNFNGDLDLKQRYDKFMGAF